MMSLPGSERHPLPNLNPRRKKERTLEALIRQLEGLARQQPVLVVFEDAHWIDPTSRELLDLVVERVRSLPVLLIVTFRPEFQPPWTGQPQVAMLTLNRLDRHDRTSLVPGGPEMAIRRAPQRVLRGIRPVASVGIYQVGIYKLELPGYLVVDHGQPSSRRHSAR